MGRLPYFFDKETVFLELPLVPYYPAGNNGPLGFDSQQLESLKKFTSRHNP